MDEQTPHLNPAELYDKRKSKDASRLRAYNKILEQIYNRIRVLSRLPNSPCYLLYTVPPFILGLPKIDLEDCVIYLMYQLRHAKYNVRYTPPNMIYISWLHHEQSYIVEQSPIMQSMMASAERTQAELDQKEKEASRLLVGRKSGRKVKLQTPGEMQARAGHIPGPLAARGGQLYSPLQGQGQGPLPKQAGTSMGSMRPTNAINTVLNRPLNSMNSLSAGPPPPSAADYVPPLSFLQNMINPQNNVVQPKSSVDYFK